MKATTIRSSTISSPAFLSAVVRPTRLEKLARKIVHSRLQALVRGELTVREGENVDVYGASAADSELRAELQVHHPSFYSDIAFGGSIGAGEAYMAGHWSSSDLCDLLRLLLINRDVLENLDSGLAALVQPARKMLHWLNRNTRDGSRKNIAAHYDLGNEFYALWLDPKMMYSSAYFDTATTSLEVAATAKLERICRKLELSGDDSVVEIGTGWGGFAIYATQNYGCHVTTTTISREQYELASERVRKAGLEDKITLLFEDYRDLGGQYDKLVSIEMIEAVGHQFHESFFQKCCELLKPDGQMLLQAITIADQQYDRYIKGVDFIRRYIFPGGCLTSVTDMARVMTRKTDMRILHTEDIGPHYARTLQQWNERFFGRIDAVREMGYSETFVRMWEFYLCYCEAAFLERSIGTVQMLIMRPGARREQIIY
ncbi:MAG: cyclopropane-fatty-acyl-phospholipid synthase family protein [Pseudomonadota bacterium]